MSFSPALMLYGAATRLLGPFAGLWLHARARRGKEDASRLGERFGHYPRARPVGPLIWLHAASVGESGVALGLIEALTARDPSLSFLISTGTRTSADLVARRALPRTTHIYAPLDRPDAVKRFFDHWTPDVGVFVESELWPNLILAAQARGVPMALVNARMSPKSLARWQSWSAAGQRLLSAFAHVSAADGRTAEALGALRGAPVQQLGNLKLAIAPPRVDVAARQALAAEIGQRPLWLAASTHTGEDEIALAAHATLRQQFPDALLIIAPRHPERGADIAALAGNAPRRSRFEPIGASPVYIADTLGELGVFYDLAPIALVGGSLLPELKGHNPIEPAKLDCAIMTGPYVESFQDLFDTLIEADAAKITANAAELETAVSEFWRNETARSAQVRAARAIVDQGDAAMTATVSQLIALLSTRNAAEPAHASA
ncbi:MAG: 3-deoxy-D-manno-octulosonic acid transferase [Hyphomonadaceae bacterium]|nr:3-deoxy-D-manno-octulosonic acid transferase [Hyphomonadaceae bacterium]